MVKLCRWFGVAKRTVSPANQVCVEGQSPALAEPIKRFIEKEPSCGYRTAACLLEMNKNTVQRTFQLKGWQVHKRAVGHRPLIQALPSAETAPDQYWVTDLCRAWVGLWS